MPTDSKFLVYAIKECQYCVSAISKLEKSKLSYSVVYLEADSDIIKQIKEAYDWPTVPIIFKKENSHFFKLIGGYDDLCKLISFGWAL